MGRTKISGVDGEVKAGRDKNYCEPFKTISIVQLFNIPGSEVTLQHPPL